MPDPPKSAEELLERYKGGERFFPNTNLAGARLQGADLTAVELPDADLTRADLRGANLKHAFLGGADLSDAKLHDACIHDVDLSCANLARSVLRGADLVGTDFTGADLRGADMRNTDLINAEFRGADLYGARFDGARLGHTNFADLDMSNAKGLDLTRHAGPSTLGIDTIYKSKGKIPEAFLRDCGVPNSFITYMRSLVGQPIEFYSCFISYSTKDEEFAKRLHARLQADHLRVWFAPEEMKGGQKLHEQIDEAIRLYDKLLLVLSPHSMASLWVQREILKARQKEERQKARVLFPIRLCSFDELRDWECLDSDTGLDLAREVRSYFIPDFSSWKDHDAFEASVTRLIKDLRADPRGTQAAAADA